MRTKTNYSSKPERFEIIDGLSGKKIVCLRTNITSKENENGILYEADEYTVEVFPSENLYNRIDNSFEEWLQNAMDEAYTSEAKKVREKRDELLRKSDSIMALDRLGLSVPTTPDFVDWLRFLRTLGEAITGEWAKYRQALRDIPQQTGFPFDVRFPKIPDEKGDTN